MGKEDYVNVKLQVGNKTYQVKMQKGVSFSNNGGTYTVSENGSIMKDGNLVSEIEMKNYQYTVFKAVANNTAETGETGIVLSKEDITDARKKFKEGGFVDDLNEFLPDGYRIERQGENRPRMSNNEQYVQAFVTNDKGSEATLKFAYGKPYKANMANQTATFEDVWGKCTVTYNAQGKPVSFKSSSSAIADRDYVYNSQGQLTEVKFPTREGSSLKYTYHPNGNVATETLVGIDGEPFTRNRTFSPNGKLLKEDRKYEHYEGKTGHSVVEYQYGNDGKLLTETVAVNMTAPSESADNYEVLPKYTIFKVHHLKQPQTITDSEGNKITTNKSYEYLGYSDTPNYKKSEMVSSYNFDWLEFDINKENKIFPNYDYCPTTRLAPPTDPYPWDSSKAPKK